MVLLVTFECDCVYVVGIEICSGISCQVRVWFQIPIWVWRRLPDFIDGKTFSASVPKHVLTSGKQIVDVCLPWLCWDTPDAVAPDADVDVTFTSVVYCDRG